MTDSLPVTPVRGRQKAVVVAQWSSSSSFAPGRGRGRGGEG